MFDIGFSELLLVGLVALLVFGPERLPGAVRTGGLWIGRLKRSFNNIKQDVEREIGADEIRRQLHNERILEMERELKSAMQVPASLLSPEPPKPSPEVTSSAPAEPAVSVAPAPVEPAPAPTPPVSEPPRQP